MQTKEEPYIYADGFDDAMIGHGISFEGKYVVYDYEKVIEILMKDMTREEAEEYFDFNIVGAYVGKNMPVFVNVLQILGCMPVFVKRAKRFD